MMKAKYGWTTYGDPQYVAHVLRYYMFEGIGGVVTTAIKLTTGYGYHIVIDHGDGTTALYGHCSELLVSQGQTVQIGVWVQIISL